MESKELLTKLHGLPLDKQSEVFDFIDFLSTRHGLAHGDRATGRNEDSENCGGGRGPLHELRNSIPRKEGHIQPINRDELYDRTSLR